ncbi:protein-methionine-sulfoxide reductase heme-binding subunit MsrQ [Tabrizicola sp. J26]|uniref:protein-methionine-sulfoxide reductase heme-binding subunit MsrQ n=1 Tax=Alitabrizicola rongguiensis TaxID=2909234 RepID=UPI001F35FE24|nr:protein-methionine-sulfoxide reductase heme-binding subunit MsrQ [Tabrizicola rongguiensis]MCF1708356.1 protein-methionine-sulfoxide reductase heme-binding subunit MsrQ [Tabrizicola rongguiensis]
MPLAETINRGLKRLPPGAAYALGLLPLGWLVWRAISGDLGVDPVKTLEHRLGLLALQFLIAGLCITPLRRLAGINLIRYRRAIGLIAFLYAVLHLAVWLALDLQFRWAEIGSDLTRRPYIVVGMVAFVLMVPLALTSNDASLRWMGTPGWRRLHQLVYVLVPLAALHFLMVVKAWPWEPILYLAAAVGLVGLRALWIRRFAAGGAAR